MGNTLLFFGFFLLLASSPGHSRKIEEEKPTEGLIQLNDANFLGTMAELAQSYDWVLVEFYSHWCPACKAFQPDYKKVATHIHNIIQEEDRSWAGENGERPVKLAVARIDCPENKKLCDDFEISKYPTMFLDRPVRFSSKTLSDMVEIDPKPRSKNGVIAELEKKLGRTLATPTLRVGDIAPGEGGPTVGDGEVGELVPVVLDLKSTSTVSDIDSDILGATIESFEYLKSRTLLKGKTARKALVDWISLLESSHINTKCRIGAKSALETLESAWPSSVNEIQDFDSFQNVQICGASKHDDWVSCQGSYEGSRGYTCGLWMLFHSLSVRMPESSETAGQDWLTVIKEFVHSFFQCKDCAEHFLEGANSVDAKSVVSKRDAILWLWKMHNKVNKRLSEEMDEAGKGDPKFPHVQWPTNDMCTDCMFESSWNEDKVYNFLFDHYQGDHVQSSMMGGGKSISVQSKQGSSWRQVSFILGGIMAFIYYYLSRSRQYAIKKAIRPINKD